MSEKCLGKISSVKFGNGVGYQDSMFGIEFYFTIGDGGGISDGGKNATWSPSIVKCSERCNWTEKDRNRSFAKICRYIDSLLHDAKVKDVYALKGKPVEITINGSTFESFRILTEVL